MNLLADESVDRFVVERLRAEGHTVEYVAELARGITDDEVLRRANDAGAVLVTADKDFGELVYRLGRAHPGVILLRLAGQSSAEKADAVAAVTQAHAAELPGAFSVVTPETVRIRRPRPDSDPPAPP